MLSSPHIRWPVPPSGDVLSWRDTALLDLARHAVQKAAVPLASIETAAADLWAALKIEADTLGADVPDTSAVDALEQFALDWARHRAAERTNSDWS